MVLSTATRAVGPPPIPPFHRSMLFHTRRDSSILPLFPSFSPSLPLTPFLLFFSLSRSRALPSSSSLSRPLRLFCATETRGMMGDLPGAGAHRSGRRAEYAGGQDALWGRDTRGSSQKSIFPSLVLSMFPTFCVQRHHKRGYRSKWCRRRRYGVSLR